MSTPILQHVALPIVIGKPNAGKTTLFNEISAYRSTLVSMGDMCREEAKTRSDIWKQAEDHMRKTSSTLWSTEAIVRMLEKNLNGESVGLIFDGLLRAPEQVPVAWDIAHRYKCNRIQLFIVETSDAECIKRAGGRGREDDPDIAKRLHDYHHETLPAIRDMVESRPFDVDKVTFDSTEMRRDAKKFARIVADIMGFMPRMA